MLNINSKYRRTTVLLFLSALSLAFWTLTVLVSDFFLAPAVGFLAALMLYLDRKETVPVYVVAVVLCFLGYLAVGVMAVRALYCPLAAFLLAFLFRKKVSKGEAAFYFLLLIGFFLIADAYLSVAVAFRSFEFETVKAFFETLRSSLRTQFASLWEQASAVYSASEIEALGSDFSDTVFDAFVSLIPACLFILAFLITGIVFKLFTFLVKKYSGTDECGINWKFLTSPLFAYVYAIVLILNFFSSTFSDVTRISIANLFVILLVVYAYIGVRFLRDVLRRRGSFFMRTLLYAGIVFFSVYALEILSLVGVWYTVNAARFTIKPKDMKGSE